MIIPANSASASGYAVDNSCRFNSGSDDHLDKTFGQAGNRKTFTVSFWIKTTVKETYNAIFDAAQDGSNSDDIYFHTGRLNFSAYYGSTQFALRTTAKFRDPGAWSHHVIAFDTTQGTASNRIKFFTNGVQETAFDDSTYPSLNFQTSYMNTARLHNIGTLVDSDNFPLDGYLSEFVFIDGTALDATSFGEFDEDSGIWKPIDVSGLTFGTNGFYLDFKNSGALGADVSGNSNNFAVTNLTAIDQSTDTCTNNFATMNPLDNFYAGGTFAEGNLQVTSRNTGYSYNTSTFGLATGKWYWEVKWSAQNTGSTNQVQIGIAKRVSASSTTWLGSVAYTYGYQGASGHVQNNDGNASGSVATTYSVGDIISVAMDLDNNKIHFAKNGTYTNSSNPATNSGGVTITAPDSTSEDSGFYFPAFGDGNNNLVETGQFNFGSPVYAISSGNTDGNGFGNFEYAVPSGYFSLNTKNLAEYG